MNQTKRTVQMFAILLSVFFVGLVFTAIPTNSLFPLSNVSSVFYVSVSLAGILYVNYTIVDDKIRKYVLAVFGMIAFCFLIRIEKYVAFKEMAIADRYLWYAYYIPIIMIPQLSFFTALLVTGTKKKYKTISQITCAVSSVLLLLVLTNDLHEIVFGFPGGLLYFDDYAYKAGYIVILVWTLVMMSVSVAVLMFKCPASVNRKLIVVPAFYLCVIALQYFLYFFHVQLFFYEYIQVYVPEIVSFMMGGLWMLMIAMGLIPSNTGYGKLFAANGISAFITDADFKVIYRSPSAPTLEPTQMQQNEIQLNQNTKIIRSEVSGGFVFQKIDLSELNRILEELEDVSEVLSEEKEIIRINNALLEETAQIEERSRVYDNIAQRVLPMSEQIKKLSSDTKNNPDRFKENMSKLCVYAVFIKRMSGLMVLSSEKDFIPKTELLLAIEESARYLEKMGVKTDVQAQYETDLIDSEQAVFLYESFYKIVHECLDNLKAISVKLTESVIKITVEGASDLLATPVNGSVESDEDVTFICLHIRKDGETE